MRKVLLTILALSLAAGMAAAADTVTLKGILMDKSCAVDMKMDAKTHETSCNQMADCAKSGFCVVTSEGKFVAFDAKGNKDAATWLKNTKEKSNLQVTVTGTMDRNVLKVAEIK